MSQENQFDISIVWGNLGVDLNPFPGVHMACGVKSEELSLEEHRRVREALNTLGPMERMDNDRMLKCGQRNGVCRFSGAGCKAVMLAGQDQVIFIGNEKTAPCEISQ